MSRGLWLIQSFRADGSLQDVSRFRFETRKNRRCVLNAHVFEKDFRKDIPEVGRKRQVSAFVQLFGSDAGPAPVNFAAFDGATSDEKATGVSMIGPAGTVLTHGSA